jgi:hypothetical protein
MAKDNKDLGSREESWLRSVFRMARLGTLRSYLPASLGGRRETLSDDLNADAELQEPNPTGLPEADMTEGEREEAVERIKDKRHT